MIVLLLGCAGALIGRDDGAGSWLRIIGPVDPGVVVSGIDTRGFVAWVWSDGRDLCAVGEEVPFEPQVWNYAIEIGGPPDPDQEATCVPAPSALSGGPALAVGLPLLVEPSGQAFDVRLDPSELFGWWMDGAGDLGDAVQVDGATVAAATLEYTLVAVGGPPAAGACALATLESGFTLYVRDGEACAPWRALAEPGVATEFQGVPMVPLPAG